MVVTHLRSRGTSENEMEALAIYMGHSVAMQVCVRAAEGVQSVLG